MNEKKPDVLVDADAASELTNPIPRYLWASVSQWVSREVWSPCGLLEWKEKYSALSSFFHCISTSAAAKFNLELQFTPEESCSCICSLVTISSLSKAKQLNFLMQERIKWKIASQTIIDPEINKWWKRGNTSLSPCAWHRIRKGENLITNWL